MAQPTTAAARGTALDSDAATPPVPRTTSAKPVPMSRRRGQWASWRAWAHAPAVQNNVAAVTATLAIAVLRWRASVIVRGTNVSVPKNENMIRPPQATATDSAPAARGTRRPTGPAPSATPPSNSGNEIHDGSDTAASTSPVATVIRSASRIDVPAAAVDVARAGMARSAGSVDTPAVTTSGTKPIKTHRQPKCSATKAARPGPIIPGSAHAVDSTANTRGRTASG